MHDAATFAEQLLKNIREDKTAVEKALAAGNTPDWAGYQHLTGTYKGLSLVESSVINLLNKIQSADS
jgi:hypothetical protein